MLGIRVYVDGNVERVALVTNDFTVELLRQQRALVPRTSVTALPQGATPLSSVLVCLPAAEQMSEKTGGKVGANSVGQRGGRARCCC